MSIEDTNPVEPNEVDLDAFSAEFFGQNTPEPEQTNSEADKEEAEQESDAPNKDDTQPEDKEGEQPTESDENSDDDDDDEDSEADEEEEAEEPAPKEQPKKKNRYQERINELNGKYREEQRQREALEARLKALEEKQQDTSKPAVEQTADEGTAPKPDDKNEDGTDKYPLGEFDPSYIRALTRHTLDEERKALAAQSEQERQQAEAARAQETLQTEWNEKLVDARERYPDFNEKGQELISSFDGIDEAYGEYLTTTIMEMDHGTDVLYYLANNPDEARAIVASGARKATIALGGIEAKFADVEAQKQLARPKVSNAPTPPPRNKGSAPAKVKVDPATDDLDAFEREFFPQKR